jgi:hypothetical protein
MQGINNIPLLPESVTRYFENSSIISYDEYIRAISLRTCLDNIVNTIFFFITESPISEVVWEKKNLNEKINLSKNYFSNDILERLHNIRKIGNKGAHYSIETILSHEEINLALEDIGKVCEWTITTYMKKYGFNQKSWIPTMLSTLPPIYRVSILEELFNYFSQSIVNKQELLKYLNYVQTSEENYAMALASGEMTFEEYKELTSKPLPKQQEFSQILLIIDKLAMAYLKNGNFDQSIEFIHLQYEEKLINAIFKEQMIDKLYELEKERDNLPISQNLQETKKYFKEILTIVKKEEYSLFLTLFTAIVAQDELINNQDLNTLHILSE